MFVPNQCNALMFDTMMNYVINDYTETMIDILHESYILRSKEDFFLHVLHGTLRTNLSVYIYIYIYIYNMTHYLDIIRLF